MIVSLEKRRIQMDHGKAMGGMSKNELYGVGRTGGPTPEKKKKKPKMASRSGGGKKRMMRKHGGKHDDRSMYMGGGMKRTDMTHGGLHAANPAPSQPTYGSTVADAMPKAGPV
tara:strand:- start:220 stop:558 length:339 start_codon:yes stop_codon:yes gene_type:complete